MRWNKAELPWLFSITLLTALAGTRGEAGQLIVYESDETLDALEKTMRESVIAREPQKALEAAEDMVEHYRSTFFLKNPSSKITPGQQALQLFSYQSCAAEGYLRHREDAKGIAHLERAMAETAPYIKDFSFEIRMATIMTAVDRLGMAYWIGKRYDDAVRIFQTLFDYFPESYARAYALRSIAGTYQLKGDVEKARENFEKVVSDFKDDPSSEVTLEVALAKQSLEEIGKIQMQEDLK